MKSLQLKQKGLPLTGSTSYDSVITVINRSVEITPEALGKYFAGLRKCGYKATTINHKLAAVRKSLKIMAERHGADSWRARYELDKLMEKNNLKRVKIDAAISTDNVLTADQLMAIIKSCDYRTCLMIQALYKTACRISELLGIRLADCEKTADGVRIKVIGKGHKERTVFLPLKLFKALRQEYQGKTYLFETRGGRQIDRFNAWRMIRRAGSKLSLKVHPHTLRHTFATLNLDRLGIHKVSRYLGHAELSTTSKFYLHQDADIKEILED